MERRPPGRVENYTIPCLIMAGVNLFWVLLLIWAHFGFLAVMFLCYVLDRLISRLGTRLSS